MSSNKDELITFKDESYVNTGKKITGTVPGVTPWKLLIVDDDEIIHTMTRMVLTDYSFEGRPLELLSAYSGKEALEVLRRTDDIALILLDVVMETDDAGLKCVKTIREELNNQMVRIILRTGQPGHAPEQEVIINYDINDYKAKTELTAQKLFTVVTASLRAYRHIKTINQNRRGLENIIKASGSLFEFRSFKLFATGILDQLISLLRLDESSLYVNISSLSALKEGSQEKYNVLAATGEFAGKENKPIEEVVPRDVYRRLMDAATKHKSLFSETSYTGYFETKKGEHNLLYLQWQGKLTEVDRDLMSIFAANVAVAFENISLNKEIIATQKEIIYTLSEIVDERSKETANHVNRVTAVSCMIASKLGMSEHELDTLKFAVPMHDIGKVGISDDILKKPGRLNREEFEIIKEHPVTGYNIFRKSNRELMKAAAIIAHQHHERWNGKGYPQGMKGEEIHIYGRITALADVVDALSNRRYYKEAWPIEKVVEEVRKERGEHFDPLIADIFLDSIEEYQEILTRFPS